jgi:predicted transcriptional regulator
MQEIRLTRAVLRILKAFVDDLGESKHGYGLMRDTGFSSAKVYQILARLTSAGWVDRLDDPNASPETGGPPRITYRLREDARQAAVLARNHHNLTRSMEKDTDPAPLLDPYAVNADAYDGGAYSPGAASGGE